MLPQLSYRRLISGVVSLIMLVSPFGLGKVKEETASPKSLEIEVSDTGKYKSIDEAKEYLRTVDKSKYSEITVTVRSGEYEITDPIEFTAEDTGSEDCPVTYIGEDGAVIIGGFSLKASDFTKGSGGFIKYFPEESKDKIMMVDLKNYGITPETIANAMKNNHYLETIPFLSADGERQTIAQYPNDWMHIDGADTYNAQNELCDVESAEADWQRVYYGEDAAETVHSWSQVLPLYIRGRFFKLWCPDDSKVFNVSSDEAWVDIHFNGGHQPTAGTIMYFYNVPEALDIPGEYIIDSDAILYYYPTDNFETARFTIPLSKGLMNINDCEYLSFINLTFTSSYDNGIIVHGNNITFDGVDISSIRDVGLRMYGSDLTFMNGSVIDCGEDAVYLQSGDVKTLTGGNVLFYNNEVAYYSMTGAYGYGIDVRGYDVLVSHNEVHDAGFKGIHFAGAVNCTAEYNDVYRLLLLCDDVGAMSIDSRDNANIVFRYNYVHDIGPEGEAAKMKDYNPEYEYYGADAFYHDGGASYVEMYGNIINGCDDGYRSNGGRCNSFHDNIVMNCRMWYCLFVEVAACENYIDRGITATYSLPEHVFSDAWKEINPDLATLKLANEGTDPFDETVWSAPAHLEAYDNYIFYNKAVRAFTNWGVRPYSYEKYILTFNPDTIEDGSKYLKIYSSARSDITVEEAIETAQDVTGITLEIFNSIGRVFD